MKTMVREVNTATEWSEFWDLPEGVYTGDPYYRSPSQAMIEANLFRANFEGRQTVWLASDGGRGVARVVARLSPTLTDDNGRPVGMLGFFECDKPSRRGARLVCRRCCLVAGAQGRIDCRSDGRRHVAPLPSQPRSV